MYLSPIGVDKLLHLLGFKATTSGGGTSNWFYPSIHFCAVMIGTPAKIKILKSGEIYLGHPV
jgi:hypothetical protein